MKFRLAMALLAPLWLANCATVVEGTDQSVLVSTDPNGAECVLKRDGVDIAAVARTPGTVVVSKSKDPIQVGCKKDGYIPTTGYLPSGFQGMTFGNILLGGFIGVAIDAGSGAMHEYPPNIALNLPPEEFPTAEARDAYFAERMAAVRDDAEAAKTAIVGKCTETEGENKGCKSQQAKVDVQRDAQLQALEAQRAQARVAPAS
ncbi:MAG: hypothetical protein RIM80_26765 [Alphaproteobacteria bacterium]